MNDVELDRLLAVVGRVGAAFSGAGHSVYLVGGIVRDHLRGRTVQDAADLDLTTDADPATIRSIVEPLADAVWTQGERFGTIGARIDDRVYEITTHRAERYAADSRKPAVEFSADIVSDLSRRDFTVNAMARRLPDGLLIDPFDGSGDLARARLRTPIDAHLSFTDDPLRMMRAARFVATLGFAIDPEVRSAIGELRDRLAIVAAERMRDELVRLLASPEPDAGVAVLVETGLAERVIPELADAPPLDGSPADPLIRLAAILADSGRAGARARMRALRFPNDHTARVAAVVGAVEELPATVDDPAVRRFVLAAGSWLTDATAVARLVGQAAGLDSAVTRLLEREGEVGFGPPVSGGELVRRCGLEPGPLVGRAVAWLHEQRLEHGPMTVDEALTAVGEWLVAGGSER